MPSWKKVIISGSDAALRSVTASNGAIITGSFRVTGSSNLIGNQTITGSLLVTQSYISKVDYIDYTVDPGTLAHSEGRTHWDVDRKTLQIDTDVNNFAISAGHVSVLRGRNTNSYTLTKGMVVYINGNSGQFATFTTASWENDPSSAYTIGLIAQDINANQFGYAVTDGEITGVNTNAFAPATLLYLSSSGQYTGTKPVAPRHTVRLGQVVVSSTNGILQVKIDNGYELGELHDVVDNTTTSSFGDLLVKSGSVWHNSRQLTGSYAITGSLQATSFTGSLQGTSSWAVSASQAITASYVAPAGSNFQIQYNNNGILGATGSFRFNYNSQSLAQGFNVTASGVYSHAEGDGARAIGEYSHAEGRTTQASGSYSHAEGRSALATGVASHAEGFGGQSIGDYSHAEGSSTQASGSYSHAEGTGTQAIGDASHAEGSSTQAIGNFSHAEGTGTQAIGRFSHAEGDTTQAIGERSHAEGYNTKSGYKGFNSNDIGTTTPGDIYLNSSYGDVSALFVVGQFIILSDTDDDNNYGTIKLEIASSFFDGINTIITLVDISIATSAASIGILNDPEPTGADEIYIGTYSHAEGNNAQAIGWYSHAEGKSTQAIGDYSHTEGDSTQAIGYVSHAEGFETIASGSQSHAEGEQTIAIGAGSHAEGKDTIAIGGQSHAEGQETQAIGDYSHAEGLGTITSGAYQHAQGQYNLTSSAQSAFIIGNGVDTNNRSNLVFASGSEFQITGSLQVTGSAFVLGLTNTSQTNVLTYNSTTGQVFFTASSAIGGGGGSTVKAGSGSVASFGGSPLTSSITFGSAFSNNSYAVTVTGEDARSWTIQSKTSAGFTINSNSSVGLTGPVYWMATPFGS